MENVKKLKFDSEDFVKNFFLYNKMENYERMIIPTLKNIARERGLRGYSRLKKSELIRKFREPIPPRDLTRTQLIQLARERGLTRYHSLRKAELIQRL